MSKTTKIPGVTRGGDACGTSLRGTVRASYPELVALLGEPQYKMDQYRGGDGKCSTEWDLTYDGLVFTLYDYKETSLYDVHLPSPEEFRALPSYDWHVGAAHGAEPFLRLLEASLAILRESGDASGIPEKDGRFANLDVDVGAEDKR